MARSDLLVSLVRASAMGDSKELTTTVEAIIAEERAKQHHILADRLAGHVPTALIALTLEDAQSIAIMVNRRLGYDRETWIAMAAASMRAEDDDGGAWH